ncbi:MAG: hypothetical protein MUF22_03235 [Chitinispirillaceae bacterium]|jgi:hypothetical protein|nr:hypothetical protein [Chitinispirillaceae bacterium]
MKLKAILSAVSVLIMIGCSPTVLINSEFQDSAFQFGSIGDKSAVKLFVADNVTLKEFKHAFRNEYETSQQFASLLKAEIAEALKDILGCAVNLGGNPQAASALLSGGYDQASIDAVQALFAETSEPYLLIVKSVEIANSVSNSGASVMVGSGGMMVGGGGGSEKCIVTIHAELWNVKEKKRVLSYSAMGQSTVFMIAFRTALKEAVSNAVTHMVDYLIDGRTT